MTPKELADRAEAVLRDRRLHIAVAIFLLALAPRIAMADHGLWQDEGREMTVARNLLQGDGMQFRGKEANQHPYVFYALLALSFLIFGASDFAGILVVAGLGAATAVLVYLLGEELYGRWAGIAGGVLMVLMPTHWVVSTRILNDVPMTFFITLAAYLFIRSERTDSSWLFYGSMAATALAGLTKLSGLAVAPILALYALYKRRLDAFKVKRYWVGLGVFAAFMASWDVRNLLVYGESKILEIGLREFGPNQAATPQFSAGNLNPLYYATHIHDFLGVPVLLLFVVGLAAIYLYRPDRTAFVLIFLGGIFAVFTAKRYNTMRYFLPFAPMAAVVAGYGVDRIRAGVTALADDPRAGYAALAVVLVATLGILYGPTAATLQGNQGFTGLQEAGNWLEENTEPGDHIIATSANQIAWYSNRDHVSNIFFNNESAVERYIVEHDVQYVELDRWEQLVRKFAPYAFEYYPRSDKYIPVQAYPEGGQPAAVIFRVNRSAFS